MKMNQIMTSLALGCLTGSAVWAEVKPSGLFCDNMVLQRDMPVPVWGTASPGEQVTVEFANQKKSATADANGKWLVKLDPLKVSSEPQTMAVSSSPISPITKSSNHQITNILVGDIWLCSGQSNMGVPVRDSANAEQEIAAAQYPELRFFSVAQNPTVAPVADVKGKWDVCSPQTTSGFPASAYFFGRKLQQELKIPIGLLHSAVGGTQAEAWTRLDALRASAVLFERAEKEIAQIKSQDEDNKRFVIDRAAWEEKLGVKPPKIADAAKNWADPALDTSDWKTVILPAQWVQLGEKAGGAFWIRKEVMLPDSAAGKPFSLVMNWVSEQYDTTFFNGMEVGHASEEAPDFYNQQRRYNVPGNLVKSGRNVIAARIVSATEYAGVWQWGYMLNVPVANSPSTDNQWLMKTESNFPPLPADALKSRPKPNNLPFRCVSSALYNGMIAPLMPFALKGTIWYQGESNTGRPGEYRELLSLMIRDWRAQWGEGTASTNSGQVSPFIIQQLVNYGAPPKDANQDGGWTFLREAQTQVADTVPDCGIAVGIDLGEELNIHPRNKQDVGLRLALVALEKTYGQKLESSGPKYESMQVEGSAIRVKFSHAEGLVAKGALLKMFAIAGEDPVSPNGSAVASKKFVWADAKIEGDTVVVSSPQVYQPVAVRYAWADNPEGCNLYNAAGLPASPFRTDSADLAKPAVNVSKPGREIAPTDANIR